MVQAAVDPDLPADLEVIELAELVFMIEFDGDLVPAGPAIREVNSRGIARPNLLHKVELVDAPEGRGIINRSWFIIRPSREQKPSSVVHSPHVPLAHDGWAYRADHDVAAAISSAATMRT